MPKTKTAKPLALTPPVLYAILKDAGVPRCAKHQLHDRGVTLHWAGRSYQREKGIYVKLRGGLDKEGPANALRAAGYVVHADESIHSFLGDLLVKAP